MRVVVIQRQNDWSQCFLVWGPGEALDSLMKWYDVGHLRVVTVEAAREDYGLQVPAVQS